MYIRNNVKFFGFVITNVDEFEWFITEDGDVMGKRVRKNEVREEVLDIFADILEEDAELLWALLRDK
jgi:hypothetical protein